MVLTALQDVSVRLDEEIAVDLGNGLTLELRRNYVKLGASAVFGEVEVKDGEVLVGGRPLEFRQAVKCPVRVGNTKLCGRAFKRPRYIFKSVYAPGLSDAFRVAELYATNALNGGDCLAQYLYMLVKGDGVLWDIYYRRAPRERRGPCRHIYDYFLSRGLRELRPHDPSRLSALDSWTKAALGLARFSEALRLADRSWRGFVVAMRYGLYSALRWGLPLDRDSWMLLLGVYSALDPYVMPGGVALDVGILRALPYLVVRMLGGWAVLFSSAGRPFVAANLNVMASGGRIRGLYAACGGPSCIISDLYFNICKELDCAIVRTWDFEYRGTPICTDLYTFTAIRPCK